MKRYHTTPAITQLLKDLCECPVYNDMPGAPADEHADYCPSLIAEKALPQMQREHKREVMKQYRALEELIADAAELGLYERDDA